MPASLFTYWQRHKSDPERTYDVYRSDEFDDEF
jgi:hypothetical protein